MKEQADSVLAGIFVLAGLQSAQPARRVPCKNRRVLSVLARVTCVLESSWLRCEELSITKFIVLRHGRM